MGWDPPFVYMQGIGMDTIIEATFDGEVFRPVRPVSLPVNTIVRLTVEPLPIENPSFLETARSLNLEGPPEWSTHLDDDRYGEGTERAD